MEELGLGPNGGLLYCVEYMLENSDWLHDELDQFGDDEYLLLDCPGQLELYTHVPIMRRILDSMKEWGYDGTMVSVFCVDAAFLVDASKFLSGSLLSLSAMIALELPHVNVLTKCDLMSEREVDSILNQSSASELWDRDQNRRSLVLGQDYADDDAAEPTNAEELQQQRRLEARRRARSKLTDAISQLLDDYSMVSFVPLNIRNEDSIDHVLATVDHAIQYGEDAEVRGADRDDDAGNAYDE
jgi:GTPase SAR1 family protein